MKRFLTTVLTVILTIVLAAGAAAGFILYRKYKPSKEQVDQSEWYQASGDETAVFFNSERVEGVQGRYIDGQTYLPLDWVNKAVMRDFTGMKKQPVDLYTARSDCIRECGNCGNSGKRCWCSRMGRYGCSPVW